MTAATPPPAPPPAPTPEPLDPPNPRAMPAAFIVRTPGVQPAVFLDLGRAMAYAARYGGQMAALYERP